MTTFDMGAAEALKDRLPIRIFLDLLTRIFDCTDYHRSVEEFVQNRVGDILQSATSGSQNQLLIQPVTIENWGKRTWIVVDVNHNTYNWYITHNFKNNKLAVYQLYLDKDRKFMTIRRNKTLYLRINQRVAELHRLNGFEVRPPYYTDYSEGADPI
jgi:hypothetical protein